MGATQQLADFVVDTRFEDLPAAAVRVARRQILDTVGVSLYSFEEPAARITIDFLKETAAAPRARVIGYGFASGTPEVGFADGILAHALDYDDVGGFDHPGCILTSTALPLAEQYGLSGKDIIEAYVIGYEVGTRIFAAYSTESVTGGTGMSVHEKGLHGTGIFGTVAAAAAAAKLLRLDAEQICRAFGIAGAQAAGIWQNAGTMAKPLMVGNAVRCGIVSAVLAKKGMTADTTIIEAPLGFLKAFSGGAPYNVSVVTANLGSAYSIISPGPGIKVYPACGGTHAAIDAALKIVREHHISADDIASIDSIGVDCSPILVGLRPLPTVGFQGKFSVPFTVAMALLDGEVNQSQFNDARLNDPRTQAIMKKVKHTPRASRQEPQVLMIKMKDGRSFTASVARATGLVGNPLSDEAVYQKYRECAAKALKPRAIDTSLAMLQELESLANVKPLMDLIAPGR